MSGKALSSRTIRKTHLLTERTRTGRGPGVMKRLQEQDMLRAAREARWSTPGQYPDQLTLGEVKTAMYGTPYHREAGDVPMRLPMGDRSDLACGMHKMLTPKDKKIIGKVMAAFNKDQGDIPLMPKAELKRALKAMGIVPTSNDHKQLVFQVCRGLSSGQHGGGAVVLEETKSPQSVTVRDKVRKIQAAAAAAVPVQGASARAPRPGAPSTEDIERVVGDEMEVDAPMRLDGMVPFEKVAPRTIRLALARDKLYVENQSDTVGLNVGGCTVVAMFRRRRATAPQPEDDGWEGGRWSPSEQNATFTLPEGIAIPPRGVLEIACGERHRHYLGHSPDFQTPQQCICWDPQHNPLAKCWAISLLDRNGNRNQFVTADVLRRRRREDVAALRAAAPPKPSDVLESTSPAPAQLFEDFAREIDAAYEDERASYTNDEADDVSEDLPADGPTYQHEAIGLRRLVKLQQQALQVEVAARNLVHPNDQGIIHEEHSKNKRVGKQKAFRGWSGELTW